MTCPGAAGAERSVAKNLLLVAAKDCSVPLKVEVGSVTSCGWLRVAPQEQKPVQCVAGRQPKDQCV